MRSRNPELMKAIRGYVESYYREHLSSPPIRNISEATGIPRATVQRYLVDMDSRGMLEYSGRVAASQTSTPESSSFRPLPPLPNAPRAISLRR